MTTKNETISDKDLFLNLFEEAEERLSAGPAAWMKPIRNTAIARFRALGFPTVRQEDWKHTNVAPALVPNYRFAPVRVPDVSARMQDFTFGDWPAHRAVFVNGRFSPDLSSIGDLPDGARLASLAEAQTTDRDLLEKYLTRVVRFQDQPFAALNTALFEDGAFLYLPKGAVLEKPVHILFIAASEEPALISPRVLIVTEENTQATVLESYESLYPTVYMTNAVTEIVAGEGSALDHYRLQQESREAFHFSNTEFDQGGHANFSSHFLAFGSRLNRNDITSVMRGEGIESTLNGLFLTVDRQHVDHHTKLDHTMPHCTSHEVFKGILNDRSTGAFTGRIIVRPGAQKTDAVQSSRNLLLSDEARITPDPQLEIYADDVKCTHGATIGQLDEDAIFYLQARGIDKHSAVGLLTYAFANEIIDEIRIEPIRIKLEQLLSARFREGTALER